MIVKNTRNNQCITNNGQQAISFWDKTLGLLKPRVSRFLLIKTRFGVHTFFLSKPVDILVLDHHYRVRLIAEELPPNHFYFYNPRYRLVFEMPAGTIKNQAIRINDKISFV